MAWFNVRSGAKDTTRVELQTLNPQNVDSATISGESADKQAGGQSYQLKRWTIDFVAWIVAFGSLMAIIGVLKYWSDRPVSDWTAGITLNTLVSVLATLVYLFLMVPVSSCIAQLKWNCFHRPRPLFYFYLVDEASRSAFASARLILTKPLFALPVFGALTTLAVQAVGPFIQQIVSQHYVRTPIGSGSLQIAENFVDIPTASTSVPGLNGIYVNPVDMPTSAAFYSGIFTSSYVDYNSSIQPTCGSTNCTWSDQYYSLGICSSCADVSEYVTYWYWNISNAKIEINLANGHYLSNINAKVTSIPLMNVSSNLPESLAFVNVSGTLLDFSVINFDPRSNRTLAMECVLRVCAQPYSSVLSRSRFSEAQQGETLYPADISGKWPNVFEVSRNTSAFTIDTPGSNTSLTMKQFLANTYANWLSPLFTTDAGHYTVDRGTYGTNHFTYSTIIAQPLFAATNSTDPSLSLPIVMDNVARSLTVNLRTSNARLLQGIEWADELRFKTSWGWIALPTLLLVAALALLILTAMDTRAKGLSVWRTSSLATMLHGLDDGGRALMGQSNDINVMEAEAKKVVVDMIVTMDGRLLMVPS